MASSAFASQQPFSRPIQAADAKQPKAGAGEPIASRKRRQEPAFPNTNRSVDRPQNGVNEFAGKFVFSSQKVRALQSYRRKQTSTPPLAFATDPLAQTMRSTRSRVRRLPAAGWVPPTLSRAEVPQPISLGVFPREMRMGPVDADGPKKLTFLTANFSDCEGR